MNLSSIYRKREDIVTRRIAGETILVPIRSNLADMQRLFTLNTAAEYIWQQLDAKRNLKEIHDGILANFEVEKDQADSDIREFISQLMDAAIIEEVT